MTPEIAVSKELEIIAKEISSRLEKITGQKMLFSLLVFQTKPGQRMNYISNAERPSVAHALASLLKGWEEGMPDIKAHEYDS